MEDSNFSESHEDFIILPSQEESQIVGMTEAVSKLPALQGDAIIFQSHDAEQHTGQSPSNVSERGSSPIEPDRASQDTTIKPQINGSSSPSPTDSSLQSKQLSNLGGFDQCEAYETQKAHVKGSRFHFFPSTQEDVFGNTEKVASHGRRGLIFTGHLEEDDGGPMICTPSEHIGSLQLSQHPMIIPETEDDTDNMIPPSPEAYGSTPIMVIPGSPTQEQDMETDGNDGDYDVTIMNTFNDNPNAKVLVSPIETDNKKSDVEETTLSSVENQKEEITQSKDVSSKEFQAALEMPTLIDEDKSESLHLHLTESTEAPQSSPKRAPQIDLTSSVGHDQRSDSDMMVTDVDQIAENNIIMIPTDVMVTDGEQTAENNIIVIPSDTMESEHNDVVGDSQNLSLRLSPSQSIPAISQRSLGERSQIEKAQGQRSQVDKSQTEKQYNERSQVEKSEGERSNVEKSTSERSQGDRSQSQRSKSQGEGSEGSRTQEGVKVRSRRQSREQQYLAANPVVIWKDESDTEKRLLESAFSSKAVSPDKYLGFHLSVPKDTPTEPPEPKISEHYSPITEGTEYEWKPTTDDSEGNKTEGSKDGGETGNDSVVEVDEEVSIRRALTVTMIQSDSEPPSPPLFKLERPQFEGEMEDVTNDTEDMFARKKVPHPQIIREDSDREEDVASSMRTNYDASEDVFIARKINPDEDDAGVAEENTETYEPELRSETVVNIDTGPNSEIPLSIAVEKSQMDLATSSDNILPEKGDIGIKSPMPAKKENVPRKLTTPARRMSIVEKPAISPDETKHIVQTYSHILAKSKRRRKSGDSRNGDDKLPSSQKPNPMWEKSLHGKLQPRRLSTQSLPVDICKSPQAWEKEVFVWASPKHALSHTSELDNTGVFVPNVSPSKSEENKSKTNVYKNLEQTFTDPDKKGNKVVTSVEEESGELDSQNRLSMSKNQELDLHEIELDASNATKQLSNVTKKMITDDFITSKGSNDMTRTVLTCVSNTKQGSGITTTAKPADLCHVTLSSQSSQKTENVNFRGNMSPVIKLANISQLFENKSPIIMGKDAPSSKSSKSVLKLSKHRQKKLKPASERNALLRSSSAPNSQDFSGMFTNSTQKFQSKKTSPGQDSFTFHGTQSQKSPERKEEGVGPIRTDLTARKRRLLHRKTGLKKLRISTDTSQHHVSFKGQGQTISQQSDIATTTSSGSLPSIPSTISQQSPRLEPILSSSSSSGRQSVAEEINRRLSGKRLSIDQPLLETLPVHSEEDNYSKVTIVTETVEKLHREITTTRKIVRADGLVLESTVDVKRMEPVIVEENTHKRVQYIYIPSPSRSASSLTSGDLGDISSSLSKSSVSSGSLGSKVSLASSASLERAEHNDSVSSRKSGAGTQLLTQKSGELASAEQSSPSLPVRTRSKPDTPAVPSTSAIISDQEASDVVTPLGSTIDKSGSHLYERTSSVEKSPMVSGSIFSSSGEKRKPPIRRSRRQAEDNVEEPNDESEHSDDGAGNSHQVQRISSSSQGDVGDQLITSSGTIGCRVIAKWKDGFYYPGTLKSSIDRYSKCQVMFDDGDSMSVKIHDILLIERLPAGQSVMVLTEEGDFECGLVLQRSERSYTVETDTGTSGSYTLSQVILSTDQASFLISDRGSEITLQLPGQPGAPANVGDVSLDNLVDTPRRSHHKVPGKIKDDKPPEQGSSTRGKKRKLDVLKPQATSTPTPKGKSEGVTKRRKIESPCEGTSPSRTPKGTPVNVKKSPRKTTKLGLFKKDVGPFPTNKIFRGMTFLLTHVVKSKEQERKLLQGSSLDTSTDESSTEDDVNAPFDKDHLKSQIETGGGTLQEDFDEKVLKGKKRCVLISSDYQRTIKYLQFLAAGLPCMSHMWIIDSCTQNRLQDEKSYILPAGISIEKRILMEWKPKDDVFIGVKAVVQSRNSEFVEVWSNILQLSKCQVHKQLQYTDVHVIVTDKTCSSTTERQARNKNIPIVSTEWVIQSLVTGNVADFTGHPRYRHDFNT